jgi:hypothetical protein
LAWDGGAWRLSQPDAYKWYHLDLSQALGACKWYHLYLSPAAVAASDAQTRHFDVQTSHVTTS